VDRVEQFVS